MRRTPHLATLMRAGGSNPRAGNPSDSRCCDNISATLAVDLELDRDTSLMLPRLAACSPFGSGGRAAARATPRQCIRNVALVSLLSLRSRSSPECCLCVGTRVAEAARPLIAASVCAPQRRRADSRKRNPDHTKPTLGNLSCANVPGPRRPPGHNRRAVAPVRQTHSDRLRQNWNVIAVGFRRSPRPVSKSPRKNRRPLSFGCRRDLQSRIRPPSPGHCVEFGEGRQAQWCRRMFPCLDGGWATKGAARRSKRRMAPRSPGTSAFLRAGHAPTRQHLPTA